MVRPVFTGLLVLLAIATLARGAASDVPSPPDLESYARMGSVVAQQMRIHELGLTEEQFAAFTAGFRAAYAGQPHPPDDATHQLMADMQRRLAPPAAAQPGLSGPMALQSHRLERYLASAREGFNLQVSPSGLLYSVSGGTGPRPGPDDRITVSIEARMPNNKTVLPTLSSPHVRTRVTDLLPGLAEGLQMMALGGNGLFVLPPHLSFGIGQWPADLEPGTPLIYRLRLEDIEPHLPIP